MGRPALSDEAKKEKGTFDVRYSAEARAERSGQVIVAFPTVESIPPCRFMLTPGGRGEETYQSLTRTLFEQKRLTVTALIEIEMIATALDSIDLRIRQGRVVPISSQQVVFTRLDRLVRLDLDRAYAGSEVHRPTNKFAKSGFAARRR